MTQQGPRPTVCTRCGASFGCGIDMNACWCQTLPTLDPARLDAAAGCYCPDCLATLVALQRQQDDAACGSNAKS
jgi:hypothetical protein